MDLKAVAPGGGRRVRLKLFVKEEAEPTKTCELNVPSGCDFKELHDLLCDNILGGENERWKLVKENRTPHLGPNGGGHIEISQEWQSKAAELLTHPADDACPVVSVDESDLRGGVDVYSIMLGHVAREQINSQEDLAAWWASHPRPGPPLLAAACARLLAKLRVAPSPHAPAATAAKLVSEGLAGLRELATDRWYGNRLPLDLLEKGLLTAMRWEQHAPAGKPAMLAGILETAAAAAWALVSYGGPRSVLVGAGVVTELVAAMAKAQEWRKAALARGEAAAAAAEAELIRQTEAAAADLAAAASAAAAAEAAIAAKTAMGPELDKAIEAANAAADAAARTPLPNSRPIYLADCYAAPAGEVSLETANRIIFNCLCALAVLSVDARARSACLAVAPRLDFLLTAATTDFVALNEAQHELDAMAWQRRQDRRNAADAAGAERFRRRREEAKERKERAEREARERAEREAAEAAAAAALEAELAAEAAALAAEDSELAALFQSRSPSPSPMTVKPPSTPTPAAEETGGGSGDGDEATAESTEATVEVPPEPEPEPEYQPPPVPQDPYPVLEFIAPEDDARVHQIVAAEALYAMLGRERGVRRAFASGGGIAALEALLRSPNDSVVCAAISALASYGRDVGTDHTTGLDMLATAAPPAARAAAASDPTAAISSKAPSPGPAARLRSVLPVVAAPPQPKKDPVVENAGKVAASLVRVIPPVLEALLARYADGNREVGGMEPQGVYIDAATRAAQAAAEAAAAAAAADATSAEAGADGAGVAGGAGGGEGADSAMKVPPPAAPLSSHISGVTTGGAASIMNTPATAAPAAAPIQTSLSSQPIAATQISAALSLATQPTTTTRVSVATTAASGPPHIVRFAPHTLSYTIELASTALWAAIAAEQRATEIRAAAAAAANAEATAMAAEAAEAAAAAAAAAAAVPLTASSSVSSMDDSSILPGQKNPAAAREAETAQAAGIAAATAAALAAMVESDAYTTPITTAILQHIAHLAVAAAKLVPAEVDDLKNDIASEVDATAKQRQSDVSGGGGSRGDARGSSTTTTRIDARASGARTSSTARASTRVSGSRTNSASGGGDAAAAATAADGGGDDGAAMNLLDGASGESEDGSGDGDRRRSSGSSGSSLSAPHSHLMGSLHALLGALCVIQGNTRLVRSEFKALLAKHAQLRRLHVQKELAEDEYQALLEEMEAARKQPGQFFFEHEEEAKREKKRAGIRNVEAEMRRELRAIADMEEGLQAAADAAVRAVSATLTLLPYGGAAGAPVMLEAPLQPSLENQLRHCHVLAAGVIQVMAATLQPGAVDAAAAAAAQLQGNWETETSISAAAAAADAATPAEELAAATAAAALYQGPYRDIILASGVLEALLAAATARFTAAATAAAAANAAPPTPMSSTAPSIVAGLSSPSASPSRHGGVSRSSSVGGLTPRASIGQRASVGVNASANGAAASGGGPSPSRASMGRSTMAASGSRRQSSTSGEPGGGASSRVAIAGSGAGGGVAGTAPAAAPPSRTRLASAIAQQSVDTSTNVLMQVTSCVLMHLASTENAMQPPQLVAIMSYMRTACHHSASTPYLAAACYSLARHVANRRCLVEGVRAARKGPLGISSPAVAAGTSAPVGTAFTSAAAAACASAAGSSLDADVWVEVIGVLLRGVLTKLRKPGGAPARVTFQPTDPGVATAGAGDAIRSTSPPAAATTTVRPSVAAVATNGVRSPSPRPPSAGSTHVAYSVANGPGGGRNGPVGQSGSATTTMPGILRSGRFLVMSLWLLLRQWVVDKVNPVNMMSSADGLYAAAGFTWWSVRFDADTPLTLTNEVLDGLALVVEAVHATAASAAAGSAGGTGGAVGEASSRAAAAEAALMLPFAPGEGGVPALRRLASRCVWSLSSTHPAVAGALVDRGSGVLALGAMRDQSNAADSELQSLCCGYMLLLASRCSSLLPPLGGLEALSSALVLLVERALASGGCWPSSPAHADLDSAGAGGGRGVDVPLLEAAVRGLAYLAGSGPEGRMAVTGSRAVRRLVAVVRTDNAALETVRQMRREEGVPAWSRLEELICPLRAINGLPMTVQAGQAASLAALQHGAQGPPGHPQPGYGTPQPQTHLQQPRNRPHSGFVPGGPQQHAQQQNQQQHQPGAAGGPGAARQESSRRISAVVAAGGGGGGGGGVNHRARSSARAGGGGGSSRAVGFADDGEGGSGGGRRSSPTFQQQQGQRQQGQQGQQQQLLDEDLLVASRQSGEADVGLMALWALLNLSGYEPAQTGICRHGLYTLMAAVHGSADPARSAAARAILTNIHYHPGNATVLYKAELKLKYAALARMLEQERRGKEAREAALRRLAATALVGMNTGGSSGVGGAATSGGGGGTGAGAPAASVDGTTRPMSARSGTTGVQRPVSRGAGGGGGGSGGGTGPTPRRAGGAASEVARQQLNALAVAAARSTAANAAAGGIDSGAPSPTGTATAVPLPISGGAAAGSPGTPGIAAAVRPLNGTTNPTASANAALAAPNGAADAGSPARRQVTIKGGTPGLPAVPSAAVMSPASGPPMLQMPGAGSGGPGADADSAVAEAPLDANTITARVRFLKWVLDPNVTGGIEVEPNNAGSGGGGSGADSGADTWFANVTAALAAASDGAGGDGAADIMTTLTADPEESNWLDMITKYDNLDEYEERLDARSEQGRFMRGVLSRSLAGGAHSLWREQNDEKGGSGGGGGGVNVRRQTSGRLRPVSDSSAAGGEGGSGANRPRSASVQRVRMGGGSGAARPGSAAAPGGAGGSGDAGGDVRRPGSALRASPPVPSLAWPHVARAASSVAAPSAVGGGGGSSAPHLAHQTSSASARFVNLYGIPTGVNASSRQAPQPHKPRVTSASASASGGGGGSQGRQSSGFALQGNPWSPHILRFVQDPPSAGGPTLRGDLAMRMLTAVAPEYVVEDLAGLTKRLMTLTADQRREEEEARRAAETAAALSRMSDDDTARRQRLGNTPSISGTPRADGTGTEGGQGTTITKEDRADAEDMSYLSCHDAPPVGPRGAAPAGTMSVRNWARHRLTKADRKQSLYRSGSVRPTRGLWYSGDDADGAAGSRTINRSLHGSRVEKGERDATDASGASVATSVAEARDALMQATRSRTGGSSITGEGDDKGEPLEPRETPLLVSLLPPVLIGGGGGGGGGGGDGAPRLPPATMVPDPNAAATGASPTSVISAPPTVIAGGGTLTAVPSSYINGSGGVAAASILSASLAPSGLPQDTASMLKGTTSSDAICAVDSRLARALHNPADAYRKPHSGLACPPGTQISTLRSTKPSKSVLAPGSVGGAAAAAAAAAATAAPAGSAIPGSQLTSNIGGGISAAGSLFGGGGGGGIGSSSVGSPVSLLGSASYASRGSLVNGAAGAAGSEVMPPVADDVPRPVTVLAGSVADLLAAKVAREADAANRLMKSAIAGGTGASPGLDDMFGTGNPFGGAKTTPGAGGGGGGAATTGASGSSVGATGANGNRTPRSSRTSITAAASNSGASATASPHSARMSLRSSTQPRAASALQSQTSGSTASSPQQAPTQGANVIAAAAAAAGGGGGNSDAVAAGGDPALAMFRPQPLSVLVATGDGGTDRLYRFPRLLLTAAHHMCLFEHVDGCRFCEALYGHYLLPNGMLAHFYLGDTVVKGHRVDLTPAPDIPFAPSDWVPDGFPACTALMDWGGPVPARLLVLQPLPSAPLAGPGSGSSTGSGRGRGGGGGGDGGGGGGGGVLLDALWCPMPLTAPPLRPEQRVVLEWDEGGADLQMRSYALEVRLQTVSRTETLQEVVEPPPPPVTKTKKKKGAPGRGNASRATSARGGSRW